MPVILLVEDDPIPRRTIAQFLTWAGHEVYEAEDGEAALGLLTSMQFDVIISDLNLPGPLSGIDILAEVKRIQHKVDAVLITALGSDEVKNRANSLGAAYMEKPFELSKLERTIQQGTKR